jgi:hypothetical protein
VESGFVCLGSITWAKVAKRRAKKADQQTCERIEEGDEENIAVIIDQQVNPQKNMIMK